MCVLNHIIKCERTIIHVEKLPHMFEFNYDVATRLNPPSPFHYKLLQFSQATIEPFFFPWLDCYNGKGEIGTLDVSIKNLRGDNLTGTTKPFVQ